MKPTQVQFMVDSVLKRDFESMAKSLVDPTRVISVATINGVTISTVRLPDILTFPSRKPRWEDIYDIHARLLQDLGEELKEHFGVEQ